MAGWAPTRIEEIYGIVHSSTRPVQVETDAGPAFIKLSENEGGPHALACDLIGTQLARWLGVPTFDLHIFRHDAFSLIDEIDGKRTCRRGYPPSLASRKVSGQAWGGEQEQLDATENPEIVTALVVLDTWTRNHDRYAVRQAETRCNHRNVFFTDEEASAGQLRLIAMDFTECIKCGKSELGNGCFTIDQVKEDRLYGLFPEFKSLMTTERLGIFLTKLKTFSRDDASQILHGVPGEWSMNEELRRKCADFLYERAGFIEPALEKMIGDACGW